MIKLNVILYNGFETLDAFGPVEVFGKLDMFYEIGYYSENGGIISNSHNVRVETLPLTEIKDPGIIMIPGGFGARREVDNQYLVGKLRELCEEAQYVLTVCTGSGLLAKTGLLKGHSATSNKMSFDWAVEQDSGVNWVRKARWVVDGKFYTSSGVSAGMDMALGFVSDRLKKDVAKRVSNGIEYIWNEDKENDPFAR